MADSSGLREEARAYLLGLQATICTALAAADGTAEFSVDNWEHERGGGGITRVAAGGPLLEKAGVNFSAVTGMLTDRLARRMSLPEQELFATGLSLVIHPRSPFVPTVHMNLRYLEPADGSGWFGGGIDLTPWYLFEEDAVHFHKTLRKVCDRYDPARYPAYKKQCDEYFYLPHRGETRGIGGIFFDYQKTDLREFFRFVHDTGDAFLPAYLPIIERRRGMSWTDREREWQTVRRGRYVEFNLLYDRGTLFGLETGGRTESILISLPPEVRWQYDVRPAPGSEEERLLNILRHPKGWA
jgi:coproporphyrinogen III oxidase